MKKNKKKTISQAFLVEVIKKVGIRGLIPTLPPCPQNQKEAEEMEKTTIRKIEELLLALRYLIVLALLFLFAVMYIVSFRHNQCFGLCNVEIFLLPAEPGKTYEEAVKFVSEELSKYCKKENSFFKVDKLSYSLDGNFYRIECNGNIIEVNKKLILIGTIQKKEKQG